MSGDPRLRRVGRGTGLVLAGAVGATALTGIALAQQSAPEDTSAATVAAPADDGFEPGSRGRGHWKVPGTGPVLHGENTVRSESGEIIDVLVQNGTITAVSETSITVQSEDEYTATYTIGSDTAIRIDRHTGLPTALQVGRPARIVANTDKVATHIGSTTEEGQAAMKDRAENRREKLRDHLDQGDDDTTA